MGMNTVGWFLMLIWERCEHCGNLFIIICNNNNDTAMQLLNLRRYLYIGLPQRRVYEFKSIFVVLWIINLETDICQCIVKFSTFKWYCNLLYHYSFCFLRRLCVVWYLIVFFNYSINDTPIIICLHSLRSKLKGWCRELAPTNTRKFIVKSAIHHTYPTSITRTVPATFDTL